MPKVVTQADVDAVPPGSTLQVAADATVTPLAEQRAAERRVAIQRGGDRSDDVTQAVRAVTRAVVDRLGQAGPQVVEAVTAEVLASFAAPPPAATIVTPRGATLPVIGNPPAIDYCTRCVEQEQARGRQRSIITSTGRNQKGIVARVTTRIAELGGDLVDISQTLVGGYFTMILVVDVSTLAVPYERFQEEVQAVIRELGCQVMIIHEGVLSSFNRV